MFLLFDANLFTIIGLMTVVKAVNIDTASCGVDIGCYVEPLRCIYALNTCDYIVTWHIENVGIRFNLTAKMYARRAPWAAVGLNDQPVMPGTSVVDCIVNASDHNRVVIQMSYNHEHHNHVLKQRFLGLVNGSMGGEYNGTHIMCTYTRLVTIRSRHAKGAHDGHVVNLTTPHYIQIAQGPTNGAGSKAEHSMTPVVSNNKILLLNYSNPLCSTKRPTMIRLHVSLMVITWMILSSIGIAVSRYMKSLLADITFLRKHLWFQIHRICMICTLLFSLVAIFVVFDFLQWELKVRELHPLLGLITTCLVALNPLIAMLRPMPSSPRRFIFRWVHGLVGHSTHLLAVATMYFGVEEVHAEMPSLAKWIVVGFGGWRLLADILLTSADSCSGFNKHKYASLSTDPSDVVVTDQLYITRFTKTAQLVIVSVYLTGAVLLAGYLVIVVNVDIC